MSLLKTISTSASHNNSKNFKKICLYLAATYSFFSSDKSPLIVVFNGDLFVAAKEPIQGPNISGDSCRHELLLVATFCIFSAAKDCFSNSVNGPRPSLYDQVLVSDFPTLVRPTFPELIYLF